MNAGRVVVLALAVVTSGLTTGLFAAFAYSVMPGLNRAGAAVGVPAMQRINAAIQNPVFALIFFGGLVSAGIAAWLCRAEPIRWWVLASAMLYLVGVLVTMGVNVPLNNRLDEAGSSAAAQGQAWTDFLGPWVRWNIVRTALHVAASGALISGVMSVRR